MFENGDQVRLTEAMGPTYVGDRWTWESGSGPRGGQIIGPDPDDPEYAFFVLCTDGEVRVSAVNYLERVPKPLDEIADEVYTLLLRNTNVSANLAIREALLLVADRTLEEREYA